MHAVLASQRIDADAIDAAMLASLGEDRASLENDYEIIKFHPFDPVSKRSKAIVKPKEGHPFKVVKGAPQVILHMVHNEAEVQEAVNHRILDFAARGYRTLGVACCAEPQEDEAQEQWTYEG